MKPSTAVIIALSVGISGATCYFVATQALKPQVVAYSATSPDCDSDGNCPPKLHPIIFTGPNDVTNTSDDLAQQRRNAWIDYKMSQ